jgi:hypothetical protein
MPHTAESLPEAALEALVREDYERCHPEETFDDMKSRAAYCRIDKGLYRDWMAIAVERARMRERPPAPAGR